MTMAIVPKVDLFFEQGREHNCPAPELTNETRISSSAVSGQAPTITGDLSVRLPYLVVRSKLILSPEYSLCE